MNPDSLFYIKTDPDLYGIRSRILNIVCPPRKTRLCDAFHYKPSKPISTVTFFVDILPEIKVSDIMSKRKSLLEFFSTTNKNCVELLKCLDMI
jgi:hypothetical protein